jgi:uncharacterized protein YbcV (DUF1398 family)
MEIAASASKIAFIVRKNIRFQWFLAAQHFCCIAVESVWFQQQKRIIMYASLSLLQSEASPLQFNNRTRGPAIGRFFALRTQR